MRLDGRSGFIDKAGDFVIETQYENAFTFEHCLAQVMIDGMWGYYINKRGEIVWSAPEEPVDPLEFTPRHIQKMRETEEGDEDLLRNQGTNRP